MQFDTPASPIARSGRRLAQAARQAGRRMPPPVLIVIGLVAIVAVLVATLGSETADICGRAGSIPCGP